jgi:hypothetical protein
LAEALDDAVDESSFDGKHVLYLRPQLETALIKAQQMVTRARVANREFHLSPTPKLRVLTNSSFTTAATSWMALRREHENCKKVKDGTCFVFGLKKVHVVMRVPHSLKKGVCKNPNQDLFVWRICSSCCVLVA